MKGESTASLESVGTPNAFSPSLPRAPCPPPRATIAPPAAEVKRLRTGEAPWRGSEAELLRQPASLRKAERGQRPNAGGRRAKAYARSEGGEDDVKDGEDRWVKLPASAAGLPEHP
jgi:hypothetical protein